jgi:transcriptional regulator with XRE-family HTH domain
MPNQKTKALPARIPEAYGKHLHAKIKELGLTQEGFAKAAGCSDVTVWRLIAPGQGTYKAARQVRMALIAMGAEVDPLPQYDGGDDSASIPVDAALERWSEIGDALRDESEEEFYNVITKIEVYLDAKRKIRAGIVDLDVPKAESPSPRGGTLHGHERRGPRRTGGSGPTPRGRRT